MSRVISAATYEAGDLECNARDMAGKSMKKTGGLRRGISADGFRKCAASIAVWQ